MLRGGTGPGVQKKERRCLIGVGVGQIAEAAKGVGAECLQSVGRMVRTYLIYFTQTIPSCSPPTSFSLNVPSPNLSRARPFPVVPSGKTTTGPISFFRAFRRLLYIPFGGVIYVSGSDPVRASRAESEIRT